MSNTLNVVAKLQINLPGYSTVMKKESSYFLKHVKPVYASWINNYNIKIRPPIVTSDLDYSLELIHEFLLSTTDDNWIETIKRELKAQTELMGQLGELYQHYRTIKCNPTGHGAIAHIFKPEFKIPKSSKAIGIHLLEENLNGPPNFCFELSITVESGTLAEYQIPIILYMINNNESEYIDATYLPAPALLVYDTHRIALEQTNLKKLSVGIIPNICEGMSLILDVLNRLSPHASLLSLVSADDEDAAIKQVKTILQMSQNEAVLENTETMPVFE